MLTVRRFNSERERIVGRSTRRRSIVKEEDVLRRVRLHGDLWRRLKKALETLGEFLE